ncbi:MAG: hypothetical protein ABR971_03680 [Acidobacteriaceae bacterium]|jgi:hypothetical protein
MNDHELYEVLCTLAATGQLSASEKSNFAEHCLHCSACRDQLHDLISIGARLQFEAAIHPASAAMPAGSLERFRARAIRGGIAPRSAPARPSPSYAMASAAAVFVIVATLVFMSHGRKAADSLAFTTTAPTSAWQSLSASIAGPTVTPEPSKAIHAHVVRLGRVPRTHIGTTDASLIDQRFPRTITTSYPFFGPQSATKPSRTGYPALSRSQISRLDLFRNLDDANNRNSAGIAPAERPFNIASTGNTFDFAANIRQLHFQLPTAQ